MLQLLQTIQRFSVRPWLAWLAVALAPAMAAAQQPQAVADTEASKASEASLAVMKAMASRYELLAVVDATANGQRKLERTAEPVERWANPVRGQSDGCLYLWTLDGRPQAALTLYPRLDGTAWNNELSSLATTPLIARFDGEEAWTPDQPGVEFKLVPGAPVPAETAARRLVQLRTIARNFGAIVEDRGEKTELRLLTAPVYRYEVSGKDGEDGAVFAFAHGTDPELLVLLETRADKGALRWHYALARQTQWPLAATYDSKPVWSALRWNRGTSHPKQTYFDRPRRAE